MNPRSRSVRDVATNERLCPFGPWRGGSEKGGEVPRAVAVEAAMAVVQHGPEGTSYPYRERIVVALKSGAIIRYGEGAACPMWWPATVLVVAPCACTRPPVAHGAEVVLKQRGRNIVPAMALRFDGE